MVAESVKSKTQTLAELLSLWKKEKEEFFTIFKIEGVYITRYDDFFEHLKKLASEIEKAGKLSEEIKEGENLVEEIIKLSEEKKIIPIDKLEQLLDYTLETKDTSWLGRLAEKKIAFEHKNTQSKAEVEGLVLEEGNLLLKLLITPQALNIGFVYELAYTKGNKLDELVKTALKNDFEGLKREFKIKVERLVKELNKKGWVPKDEIKELGNNVKRNLNFATYKKAMAKACEEVARENSLTQHQKEVLLKLFFSDSYVRRLMQKRE